MKKRTKRIYSLNARLTILTYRILFFSGRAGAVRSTVVFCTTSSSSSFSVLELFKYSDKSGDMTPLDLASVTNSSRYKSSIPVISADCAWMGENTSGNVSRGITVECCLIFKGSTVGILISIRGRSRVVPRGGDGGGR